MYMQYGDSSVVVVHQSRGYTLIELIIAVAIIGILAAIVYPNYQNYIIKTKRANMMTDMQNMASQIESKKMMFGGYTDVPITSIISSASFESQKLYNVAITPSPLARAWEITATPKSSGVMSNDGALILKYNGEKCRASKCGMGDEWR